MLKEFPVRCLICFRPEDHANPVWVSCGSNVETLYGRWAAETDFESCTTTRGWRGLRYTKAISRRIVSNAGWATAPDFSLSLYNDWILVLGYIYEDMQHIEFTLPEPVKNTKVFERPVPIKPTYTSEPVVDDGPEEPSILQKIGMALSKSVLCQKPEEKKQ
jgi:hypothetical protein